MPSLTNTNSNNSSKDPAKARSHREEGNRLHSSGNYKEACYQYSQSLRYSPTATTTSDMQDEQDSQPPKSTIPSSSKSSTTPSKASTLSTPPHALAYANRSASLFELKLYTKSLQDIESAIESGYPTGTPMLKIARRRSLCLRRMFLSEHDNDESNRNVDLDEVEECMRIWRVLARNTGMEEVAKRDWEEWTEEKKQKEKDVLRSESREFPRLRILMDSKTNERRLIAEEDVVIGQCLFEERAFVCVPQHDRDSTDVNNRCENCLAEMSINPI
ncbi:hypothetical protein HDU76_011007, partial [Blyttiomyces sp. JEL0837]